MHFSSSSQACSQNGILLWVASNILKSRCKFPMVLGPSADILNIGVTPDAKTVLLVTVTSFIGAYTSAGHAHADFWRPSLTSPQQSLPVMVEAKCVLQEILSPDLTGRNARNCLHKTQTVCDASSLSEAGRNKAGSGRSASPPSLQLFKWSCFISRLPGLYNTCTVESRFYLLRIAV